MYDFGKDLQRAHSQGEWDMFERITSVWYGKQYYFLEDGDRIYSRASRKTVSREEAFKEFLEHIEPKE